MNFKTLLKLDESETFDSKLQDLIETIEEAIDMFDDRMSAEASKGRKVVDSMADGTYELLMNVNPDEDDIYDYADEATRLSMNDMGEEDEDFYNDIQDTWRNVKKNASAVAAYMIQQEDAKKNAQVVKVLKGALKRLP